VVAWQITQSHVNIGCPNETVVEIIIFDKMEREISACC